jgi:hypothetical protein
MSERVDYARLDFEHQRHHARFRAHVKAHGLPCQACGGRGCIGYDSIYDGPADPCGWCETTGRTTRWLRGQYLTYMRSIKPRRKAS